MFNNFFTIYKLSLNRIGNIFYVLLLFAFVGIFFELLGITLFLPLFNIIENESIGNDNFSKYLGLILNQFNLSLNFFSILSLILLCFISKFIFLMIISYFEVTIITKFQKNIQIKIITLLENAKNKFHTDKNTGTIVNLISRETDRYVTTIRNIIRACVTILTSLVFISYLLFSNFFELIALFFFSIIIFLLFKPLLIITKKFSLSISTNYSEVQNLLIEMVNNFNYLKATENTKKFINFINERINLFNNDQKKIFIISKFMVLIKEPIGVLVMIILLIYFVHFLNQPLGSVIIVSIIFYKISQNFFDIQNNLQRINSSLGGVYFVEENIKQLENNQDYDQGTIEAKLKKNIHFNNISVNFNEIKALQNINFQIKSNTTVGIVGPSGSGKSTMLNLILGLIKPSKGAIFLGDDNFSDINLKTLRSKIGYVSQENALFNGTISENINYLSNQPVNYKKIEEISKQIGFENIISRLDENIGEQGNKLSGGQKQRVAIIRELYKDPELLIFDEATSSLDNESEDFFKKTINSLAGKKTIIIISHNLFSVKNCDNILLINKGSIKSQGKYDKLLEEDELFKKLLNLQKS